MKSFNNISKPLLRGPSQDYGCTPGGWVYTTAPTSNTEQTGYSLVDIPKEQLQEGIIDRTEVRDNIACVAVTEIRRDVNGAVLIVKDKESVHPTATAALHKLMEDLI